MMSSYLRVLRHPDFRYLFLGQSGSAVGEQVVIVALALYVTQRTGSATELGLVLAAQSVRSPRRSAPGPCSGSAAHSRS
jgi:hypothetical protein